MLSIAIWYDPAERLAAGISVEDFDNVKEALWDAAALWNRYLDVDAQIDLRLRYAEFDGGVLASAGPIFYGGSFTPQVSDVFSELTGTDDRGEMDGNLTIDTSYLRDGVIAFPGTRNYNDNALSSGYDAVSLLAHELGHVLGFNDRQFQPFTGGGNSFTGSKAMAEYGGAVPLSDGVHLAVPDLLFSSLSPGERVPISPLDIAILDDLGLPIRQAGASNDVLWGFELHDDTLAGLGGNDVLWGLTGDDRLIGGAGIDAARYRGGRQDFSLTENADGSWTVTDLNTEDGYDEGTDQLIGIERVIFADGVQRPLEPETFTVAPVAVDDRFTFTESEFLDLEGFAFFNLNADNGAGPDVDGYILGAGPFITISAPIFPFITHINGQALSGAAFEVDGVELQVLPPAYISFAPTEAFPDLAEGEVHIIRFSYTLEENMPGEADGTVEIRILGTENEFRVARSDAGVVMAAGAGRDVLLGGDGPDILDGGPGADILQGGLGNDFYVLDDPGDVIEGEIAYSLGGGIDTARVFFDGYVQPGNIELLRLTNLTDTDDFSATGNDAPGTLVGNAGANMLTARGGNDQVNGNGGDDTLIGNTGRDTLVGGAGSDTFVYTAYADSRAGSLNRDVINGFDRLAGADDVIDLSAMDADTTTFGVDDAFVFVGAAAFSGQAGELRTQGLGGPNAVLVEADHNGDRVADFQIFINLTTFMTEGDFLL